jgi:hypothetical protein
VKDFNSEVIDNLTIEKLPADPGCMFIAHDLRAPNLGAELESVFGYKEAHVVSISSIIH